MKISTVQTILITAIPSILAKPNSLRRTLLDCVSKEIDSSVDRCDSNGACTPGSCRLFNQIVDGVTTEFLDCDEGNNFEGIYPALCDGDSEPAEPAEPADDDGADVPVRSDCVSTSSTDYATAKDSGQSTCDTSDDCSVGLCRMTEGDVTWLFCDENSNFGFWKPVCDEEEVPIRQPGLCFPGTARVTVLDKGDIPMSQLQLGDSILVDTMGNYESVYTFGHYYHYYPESPKSPFMKIKTAEGSELTLSLNHMVKTATSGTVPAVQIKKGDSLLNSSGKIELVESTKKIQLQQGMYAPFTASGYLIVDDMLVSNYVALQEKSFLQIAGKSIASHQWIAHAFNAPHRMYCRYVTACTTESYNAEGMSQYVATPFALSQWILEQNTMIMGVCCVMIVMLCGIFSLMEQYPILLLLSLEVVIAFLFGRSLVKRMLISRKRKEV